jgi:prevent-host-death family protein
LALAASVVEAEQSATFVYMDATIGIRELRQNLSVALKRVAQGERLVVTDHNRPVAQLVPLDVEKPGLARLIAQGKVTPPEAPLELPPLIDFGDDNPATRALEYERGKR